MVAATVGHTHYCGPNWLGSLRMNLPEQLGVGYARLRSKSLHPIRLQARMELLRHISGRWLQ